MGYLRGWVVADYNPGALMNQSLGGWVVMLISRGRKGYTAYTHKQTNKSTYIILIGHKYMHVISQVVPESLSNSA